MTGSFLLVFSPVHAEERKPEVPDRAAMIAAARELFGSQTFCALITLDASGRPQVRTMNPLPPEEDMTVHMATSTRSLE